MTAVSRKTGVESPLTGSRQPAVRLQLQSCRRARTGYATTAHRAGCRAEKVFGPKIAHRHRRQLAETERTALRAQTSLYWQIGYAGGRPAGRSLQLAAAEPELRRACGLAGGAPRRARIGADSAAGYRRPETSWSRARGPGGSRYW